MRLSFFAHTTHNIFELFWGPAYRFCVSSSKVVFHSHSAEDAQINLDGEVENINRKRKSDQVCGGCFGHLPSDTILHAFLQHTKI